MTNAAEILKSVQIGLDVAIFLLSTDRGLQATELCNECLFLLHKLDSGIDLDHDIPDVLFNVFTPPLVTQMQQNTPLNLLTSFVSP